MDTRLFFIGDSFVNGTGDPEALGWVGRVCTAIQASGEQLTVYNLGIRGDTTRLIDQRWQREVGCRLTSGNPAAFVFSFGANDVDWRDGQQRVATAQSLDNALSLFTAAQKLGPVIMVGSPPIADDPAANQRLAKLCQSIAAICRGRDIPFVPTMDALLAEPAWMGAAIANDGAHPRAAGYQALANLLIESQTWQTWLSSVFPLRVPSRAPEKIHPNLSKSASIESRTEMPSA
jgi:lysophospholipase L1-like esterase